LAWLSFGSSVAIHLWIMVSVSRNSLDSAAR
jgi:hypothetical protein